MNLNSHFSCSSVRDFFSEVELEVYYIGTFYLYVILVSGETYLVHFRDGYVTLMPVKLIATGIRFSYKNKTHGDSTARSLTSVTKLI